MPSTDPTRGTFDSLGNHIMAKVPSTRRSRPSNVTHTLSFFICTIRTCLEKKEKAPWRRSTCVCMIYVARGMGNSARVHCSPCRVLIFTSNRPEPGLHPFSVILFCTDVSSPRACNPRPAQRCEMVDRIEAGQWRRRARVLYRLIKLGAGSLRLWINSLYTLFCLGVVCSEWCMNYLCMTNLWNVYYFSCIKLLFIIVLCACKILTFPSQMPRNNAHYSICVYTLQNDEHCAV